MLVTGLLQEVQAEDLDNPSNEDQTYKWGDSCNVLGGQRHRVEVVEIPSAVQRFLRKAQAVTWEAWRYTM